MTNTPAGGFQRPLVTEEGSWVKVNGDVGVAGDRSDDGGGDVPQLRASGAGSTPENLKSGAVIAVVLAHHHTQC